MFGLETWNTVTDGSLPLVGPIAALDLLVEAEGLDAVRQVLALLKAAL